MYMYMHAHGRESGYCLLRSLRTCKQELMNHHGFVALISSWCKLGRQNWGRSYIMTVTWPHVTWPHMMSHDLTQCHMTSHNVTWPHMMSWQSNGLSYDCHMTSSPRFRRWAGGELPGRRIFSGTHPGAKRPLQFPTLATTDWDIRVPGRRSRGSGGLCLWLWRWVGACSQVTYFIGSFSYTCLFIKLCTSCGWLCINIEV